MRNASRARSVAGRARGISLRGAFILAGLSVVLAAAPANAFSTKSSVRPGCHERMTLSGIASAGWPDGASPPPLRETERRIAADLPFSIPQRFRDPWSIAMVLGNRHVDLQGKEATDLPALSEEAAKPEKQRDHCLRAPDDDGPEGDQQAIDACHEYILEQVEAALGEGEEIDLEAEDEFEIELDFRGVIDVELNRYAFRMGMALHALQDSFAHAFRTPDGRQITHVLNYADFLRSHYDEARDGYRHLSVMDECEDTTDRQEIRAEQSALASAQLLAAVADPTGGREGRVQRVMEVLDDWISLAGGERCTIENDYCDAPEPGEETSGCAVLAPGLGSDKPALWLFGLLALAIVRRRKRAMRVVTTLMACAAFVGLATSPALAQPREEPRDPNPLERQTERAEDDVAEDVRGSSVSPEVEAAVQEADRDESVDVVGVHPEDEELEIVERRRVATDFGDPINRGLGIYVGGTGSLDNASLAAALGFRFDALSWLQLGIDAEYNPWLSLSSGNSRTGVANFAVAGIVQYGVIGPVELRTTVHAGISVLLWDMVGADAWSVGPFVGITPLGVAFRTGRALRIIIDPGGFYVCIPQTAGVPLAYAEHRFTVGVQWTPEI